MGKGLPKVEAGCMMTVRRIRARRRPVANKGNMTSGGV